MVKVWSILLLFFPAVLFSQAAETDIPATKDIFRAYIGLSYGPSVSLGSFARDNNDEGIASYAKNGRSLQILDYGFRVYKNLNIAGHYIRLSNSLAEGSLEDDLRGNGFRYTVDASNYELNAGLIGIGFIKESNSIALQMQVMLGYGNIFLPSISLVETDSIGNSTNIKISSNAKSTLGLGIGGGIRIHLNKYLDFTTFATYVNFQKSFSQRLVTNGNKRIQEGEINYEVVNVSFGFAYRFLRDNNGMDQPSKY